MHIKSSANSKLKLSIYLFFVIFAPPLVPKTRFVIGMATMVYLLILKQININKCLFDSRIYIWAVGIVLFLSHIFLMIFANELLYGDTVQLGHYASLFNRFLISLVEILPCSIYIMYKMNQLRYGVDEFLTIVFGAALIEVVTVILAVISPDIKNVFNRVALVMSERSSAESKWKWFTTVRSFGFADTLVDTYGWGTGLIAGLALIYGVLKQRKYIIVSFVLLVAPLFNARTGVVLYAAAVVIVAVYCITRLDIFRILKMIICFCIFIVIGALIWDIIAEHYPVTVSWIESGLNDFTAVIGNNQSNKDVSGFALMLQKESWWELPQFPRNIFGTGHSRYGAEGYSHSDFGYVNDIWAGGIYGCIILYGTNLIFTLRLLLRKQVDICHRVMLGYLCITLFAFNVKACAYGCNSGLVSYTIIVSYINYYYKNKKRIYTSLRMLLTVIVPNATSIIHAK